MVSWAAEGQQQGRAGYGALMRRPPPVRPAPQVWQHKSPPQDARYCQRIPQLHREAFRPQSGSHADRSSLRGSCTKAETQQVQDISASALLRNPTLTSKLR